MYWRSKYIVIDTGMNVLPIIFSELQQHAEVARALYPNGEVLGAGFVCIDENGHYQCFGESVSLKAKARPEEDSRILNKYLGVIQD